MYLLVLEHWSWQIFRSTRFESKDKCVLESVLELLHKLLRVLKVALPRFSHSPNSSPRYSVATLDNPIRL